MSIAPVYNMPGVQSDRTATQRRVLKQGAYDFFAGGGVIDGSKSRDPGNTSDVDKLRAGILMGLITSTDKWAPSVLGVTTNAEAIGSTSIETGEFVGDELVRRVGATGTFTLTGPAAASGVVISETVTYSAESAGTITVTAINGAFIAGSLIAPTDGSQIPRSFIPDGFPCKMTDGDGANIDVEWPCLPIGGLIDSSQLLPWPSDASLQLWIANRLNSAFGGRFSFDHVYMGE